MSESRDKNQASASAPEQAVPSRTLGLSFMCLAIAFVAVWMQMQAGSQDAAAGSAESTTDAGLSAETWYLPDEPLLGFVNIPAGVFTMGSNPTLDRMAYENERWSSTRRQGSVALDAFYIGRFEVAVAQYRMFARQNPEFTNAVPENAPGNLPITNITWPEALAYARWLEREMRESSNTPEELKNFLESGGRLSLPSEAEWEKAARGDDGRIFPWGNTPSTEFANYGSNAPLPIGSKPCNQCAHNLQDMSGNVWELTRSPLEPYPFDPQDDAANLSQDALWVMRGGSFADGLANVRAAVRGGVDPSVRNNGIGFRLVISRP